MKFSSPVRRHFSSTTCKAAETSDKIHRHPVRIDQVHLRARHKPFKTCNYTWSFLYIGRPVIISSEKKNKQPITTHYYTPELFIILDNGRLNSCHRYDFREFNIAKEILEWFARWLRKSFSFNRRIYWNKKFVKIKWQILSLSLSATNIYWKSKKQSNRLISSKKLKGKLSIILFDFQDLPRGALTKPAVPIKFSLSLDRFWTCEVNSSRHSFLRYGNYRQ